MRRKLQCLPGIRSYLLFLSLLAVSFLFLSCQSTKVYVRTYDKVYEDNVLISSFYTEKSENKELKEQKIAYHDLSNLGYIITSSEDNALKTGSQTERVNKRVAHSFTVEKIEEKNQQNDKLVFNLIETRVERGAQQTLYYTNKIGSKTCRIDKNGKILSSFEGDAFNPEDDELFQEIIALCADSIINANKKAIVEKAGKSYKTEEKIETIKVESTPNSGFITYSILGKPFVILGTTAWNLLKCLGYSFYNFTGGYSLVTNTVPDGMSPWKMPSMDTAKEKFNSGKEKNKIQYYPEYHVAFTDNKIFVDTVDQYSLNTFITDSNIVTKRDTHIALTNKLSVSMSASADAEYTAGVVGLIGTGLTIPISGLTWIGGAAVGIASQIQQ